MYPTPKKVGDINRKSWRHPPKITYGSRAKSTPCSTVDEEDVYKITQSHFTSDKSLHGLEDIYAMAEAPLKPLYPEDPSLPHRVDRAVRVNVSDVEAVYKSSIPGSPPVSTGSCDSFGSSGHDSPHVLPGDVTSAVGSFTPVSE